MTQIDWSHFRARLEADLPIADLLAWVLAYAPDASAPEVQAMVQRICQSGYDIRPVGNAPREYAVAGDVWQTFAQSVARPR